MGLAALQVIPALLFAVYGYASGQNQRADVQLQQVMAELETRVATGNPDDLMGFPWGLNIDALANLILMSLLSLLISSFIMRSFVQGATVGAVGDSYRNHEPSFGAAVRVALNRLMPLLGWAILSAIAVFGMLFILIIPCLGPLILVPLLAFFGIRLMFVPQAIVAENMDVFQAMSHSWSLSRGSFWRLFTAWLLFVFLTSLGAAVLVMITSIIFGVVADPDGGMFVALNQGTGTMIQLLVLPIAHIGITLVYYDQLRRMTAPPPPPQQTIYPPYQ